MVTLAAQLTSQFETYTGRRRVTGLISLGLAGLSAFIALSNFSKPLAAPDGWIPYLSAPVFFITGVYLLFPSRPAKSQLPSPTLLALGCLLAILGLAAFMRFYQFDTLPFGTWSDEADIGLVAQRILDDPNFRPYFVETNDHPLHFFALVALSFKLFGASTEAVRLVSVLFGLGAVGVAFLAGREMYSDRFGLLLAFFLAISRWHVTFSRFGLYTISLGFFEVLTIWLLLRARRTGQLHAFVWAGLALGFSANFYIAARLFVAVVLIYLIYWLVVAFWPKRKPLLQDYQTTPISKTALINGLVAFALGVLFSVAPLIQFALTRPEVYWSRVNQASIFTTRDEPDLGKALTSTLTKHLLMFNYEGDWNGRHNISGEPMLDPLTGVLFILGAALAFRRFRHPVNILMFLLFAVNLAGGILSLDWEAPQGNRVFGAIVVVMYFVALAVETLWRSFDKARMAATARQAIFALALVGMGGYIVYDNANTYFVRQANTDGVWLEYNGAQSLIIYKMLEFDPARTRYYVADLVLNPLLMRFLAPQIRDVQTLSPPIGLPLRESGQQTALLFADPNNKWIVEEARQYYPAADYKTYTTPEGSDAVYQVLISPEQIQELQGATLRYWPGETPQGEPAKTGAAPGLSAAWPAEAAPLSAPFVAQWDTTLYAPQYGDYEFILQSPGAATLWLDRQELAAGSGEQHVRLSLAQGDHNLRLQAAGGEGAVSLEWRLPTGERGPIPITSLYLPEKVPVRGLLAAYYQGDSWAPPPALVRIDPFLNTYFYLTPLKGPFTVEWTGRVNLPSAGEWAFALRVENEGNAEVFIDDQSVVNAPEATDYLEGNKFNLTAGWHKIRVRYANSQWPGRINLYWVPPDESYQIVPEGMLSPY